MDSVIMTTPGNGMRLRSRLRSAANTLCARNSKNKNHYYRNNSNVARNFVNRHHQNNQINNLNNQRSVGLVNGVVKRNGVGPAGFVNTTSIAREVSNACCKRLGDVTRIPSDSVQALFNDMHLYPSKSQVLEMLQCARQCGRRNSSQYLTLGEVCVFVGEMRRGGRSRQPTQLHLNNHHNHHHHSVQKCAKPLNQCEVFLGGSCNPTTWRADIAIPTLLKLGITYYNPQVSTWSPDLMAAEHEAKESAAVLLFVCDSQTRCVAGMLEVAHLIAKQRCLVIVMHPFTNGQAIMGETLSPQEFVDLSEGQGTLLTLVRNHGIAVHSNLTSALQCTVNILRGPGAATDPVAAERKITDKLIKLREVFDMLDTNRTGELSLSDVNQAYYQLTGYSLRISDLLAIMDMSQQQQEPQNVRISFEQFCSVVAEFTTTDGGTAAPAQTDDWINQPPQRQSSTNNNSNFEFPSTNGHHLHQNGTSNGHAPQYDVYLGGSCMKHTTWRQRSAIPLLKRYGVTYYNPSLHENVSVNGNDNDADLNDNSSSVVRSASRDLLQDMFVMNESKIVLFVITNETRSITSMILAAHYIALRKNVVLCVQQLALEDCTIGPDLLSKQAIKDYNRARAYLSDLAKHENVPIFETVEEAVKCTIDLVHTSLQQR